MRTLRVTYTELLLLRRLCKTIGIDANDLDFMVMPSDFGFKRSATLRGSGGFVAPMPSI